MKRIIVAALVTISLSTTSFASDMEWKPDLDGKLRMCADRRFYIEINKAEDSIYRYVTTEPDGRKGWCDILASCKYDLERVYNEREEFEPSVEELLEYTGDIQLYLDTDMLRFNYPACIRLYNSKTEEYEGNIFCFDEDGKW